MRQKKILRIALPTPLLRLFDYIVPISNESDIHTLAPGVRVRVPFQSRQLIGILIEVADESRISSNKLKSAIEILDEHPLFSDEIFKLCQWAADYYHYALGEVLSAALPTLLRQGKALPAAPLKIPPRHGKEISALALNAAQAAALQAINAANNHFQVFLLDGVTGSGKTEVYLRAIHERIETNEQVLVLVPEISLTPQTIARFQARFDVSIASLHSSMTPKQRLNAWAAAKSGEAKIVIGTRSAIFTPFAKLGMIVVDEEHDSSFKQQDRFRYHARDLAVMRASINQIPIVLGSATPSLESLFNVQRKRYQYLNLPMRAGDATLPSFQLIDLRQSSSQTVLSEILLTAMTAELKAGHQVMLFINRRGFAPVLYCTSCSFIVNCKRCDTRMVYHRNPPSLQCHHCDAKKEIPTQCPQCHEVSLQPVGVGTQRLEQQLKAYFPEVPIIRIDRDSTRVKGAMQQLLDEINQEKPAILLGTQMLGKGHHFPRITLVGIVDADAGLFSVDFRAAEQMGQLLLQVAGRAGRAEHPGKVLIQTRNPTHPLLQILLNQGYQVFAQHLLSQREHTQMPPYSYFALFRAEAHVMEVAVRFLQKLKSLLEESSKVSDTFNKLEILGPVPALLSKRKGYYCQHLLIKSPKRNELQSSLLAILKRIEKLPQTQSVRWSLDVDPIEVV